MKTLTFKTIQEELRKEEHGVCFRDIYAMTSPKQQREAYIFFIKKYGEMYVNCKHRPQLKESKVLRDMLKDGTLRRETVASYSVTKTVLYLNEEE